MLYLISADCEYGNWTDWTPCSSECGMGNSFRSRTIEKGEKGDGKICDNSSLVQKRSCEIMPCPITTPAPFNSRSLWCIYYVILRQNILIICHYKRNHSIHVNLVNAISIFGRFPTMSS